MHNWIASGRFRPLLIPPILILALVLLAAACGDGEGGGPTPTRAPTPAAATPTPVAKTSFEIKMVPTLRFDKPDLTVPVGSEVTVRFDNQDTGVSHNWAVYTDSSASTAIAGANENICSAPCSGEVTFGPLAPGEYFFRCDVHPTQMTGKLTVQ